MESGRCYGHGLLFKERPCSYTMRLAVGSLLVGRTIRPYTRYPAGTAYVTKALKTSDISMWKSDDLFGTRAVEVRGDCQRMQRLWLGGASLNAIKVDLL